MDDYFQAPTMFEVTVIVKTSNDDKEKSFETYLPTFPYHGMILSDDEGDIFQVNRVIVHGFSEPEKDARSTPLATCEVISLDENIA